MEPFRVSIAQVFYLRLEHQGKEPSSLSAMDKDALKKQIENMKYQATMERWPLSKSIAA